MNALFVLYDSRCGVCAQLKGWLLRQLAYVPLHFVALDSAEARERFPMLGPGRRDLAVIADTGETWLEDRAWIICLWALREYRSWAETLSSPAMLPLAKHAFLALSRNRFALSGLLGLRSEEDRKRYLEEMPVPPCQIQP